MAEELELVVCRTEAGSLGVDVDESNTIAGNSGQPALVLGDRIVAVDGERLDGRHISQVLTPGQAEYTFVVVRDAAAGSAALQEVLLRLCAEASEAPGSENAASRAAKIEEVAAGLEASGGEIAADTTLGFWSLAFSSLVSAETPLQGLSGYGPMPGFAVARQWQLFADPENEMSVQTVEILANSNTGTHVLAALKGAWAVDGDQVVETYTRLEYAGALAGNDVQTRSSRLTFINERIRVCRIAGPEGAPEELCVYVRQSAESVQARIGELMAKPVLDKVARPRWEQADLERGLDLGGPTQTSMIP